MRRVWLISLVLFLAVAGVFSRVLVADFVQWDDDISVYQNPHIQGLDWGRLRWMFSDAEYAMRYKPLTWLAYALVYQVAGLNPLGYHLANLLLHGFNAVLVFLVIRRLLAAAGSTEGAPDPLAQATPFAGAAALLWALNPLQVEPVARVTDLTFCLQLLFLLLSLWLYLGAFGKGLGPHKGGARYWASVVAFGLAMLAYPLALGYGIVLLVLDWYPLRRFEIHPGWWRNARVRGVLWQKLPFFLLGGAMLPTIFARLNPTGLWAGVPADSHFSLFARAMQAFYVWAYYVWRPWWPFHLSPLYTALVDFNPNAWPFWLNAALVVGATALTVLRRRRWPWALALWVSYLVLLVPVLGLTERPHYTADRYDYLPSLVWAVAVAAALRWICARRNPGRVLNLQVAAFGLAIGLAVFWGTLSVRQTRVWRNSVSLFEHMIGELKSDPYRSDIQWRLGAVFAGQGETQQAQREYEASLAVQPTPTAHLGLAELLERNGDVAGASAHCRAALALEPTPLNRVQAGQVLASLGRYPEAVQQYRVALASIPSLVPALNNLAWVLASAPDAANRDGAEAVVLAERACALTEYHMPVVIGTLAAAYAEAGRFKDAVATAEKAREMAQAMGERGVAERNGQLLELYRSGRPYHEPARR